MQGIINVYLKLHREIFSRWYESPSGGNTPSLYIFLSSFLKIRYDKMF